MSVIVNSNFENYNKNHFEHIESKFNLHACTFVNQGFTTREFTSTRFTQINSTRKLDSRTRLENSYEFT